MQNTPHHSNYTIVYTSDYTTQSGTKNCKKCNYVNCDAEPSPCTTSDTSDTTKQTLNHFLQIIEDISVHYVVSVIDVFNMFVFNRFSVQSPPLSLTLSFLSSIVLHS